MLILGRRLHEKVKINSDITIEIVEISRGYVRLGFTAPDQHIIHREEIFDRNKEEALTRKIREQREKQLNPPKESE